MAIENPNSSGQGHDAEHAQHALHAIVIKYGYVYSHSTPIHTPNGNVFVHHTYKLSTHSVGLYRSESWDTSTYGGSSHRWYGKGAHNLDAHLKSKRKRYATLRSTDHPSIGDHR